MGLGLPANVWMLELDIKELATIFHFHIIDRLQAPLVLGNVQGSVFLASDWNIFKVQEASCCLCSVFLIKAEHVVVKGGVWSEVACVDHSLEALRTEKERKS